jgi:hypothetical protein
LSSLNLLLSGTILPWLMGLLLLLGFLVFLLAMKSWRDTKRSPYFFMRQQAARRMQSYLSITFVLVLMAAGVGVYGWRSPDDGITRMAILANAKPANEEIRLLMAEPLVRNDEGQPVVGRNAGTIAETLLSTNDLAGLTRVLPPQYDRFEPTAELNPTTELGAVTLSDKVTVDYQPVNPASVFREGSYTLYATFSYKDMADGMEWAWVWRRNGEIIDGGNELWAYGDEGPGYIYLSPEEGFLEGAYSLEIWVNGELMGQTSATMNDAAVAAGN